MDAIKAVVRNGRIETDTPLDLPDGTELMVICMNAKDDTPCDESPEAADAWLKWHDSVQPQTAKE